VRGKIPNFDNDNVWNYIIYITIYGQMPQSDWQSSMPKSCLHLNAAL